MGNFVIDDDFLYRHMPIAEKQILDGLPKEDELSYKFSKRFERKMRALIIQEKRTPFMHSFVCYSKKFAMVFLIIVSLSFTVTMSVEAYRVRFFEIVSEVWQELTSVMIKSEYNADNDILVTMLPQYIPNSYKITESDVGRYSQRVYYRNNLNEEI